MSLNNIIGRLGENLAAKYLSTHGYKILRQNYRFGRAEIDIVVEKDSILIFIEVKTRTTRKHGEPELSIGEKKVILMMDAAYAFMEEHGYNWEIRFDVISIILQGRNGVKVNHLIDAFVP